MTSVNGISLAVLFFASHITINFEHNHANYGRSKFASFINMSSGACYVVF